MSNSDIKSIIKLVQNACKEIYSLLQNYTYTTKDEERSIKLDIECNSIICRHLTKSQDILYIISEEMVDKIIVNQEGKYIVAIDPLDGSANIENNLSVGSIFSIYKYNATTGRDLVASGYCLYTYSCVMVYSLGKNSTYFCDLNKNTEEKLIHNKHSKQKYYCINNSMVDYNEATRFIVERSQADRMTHRWTGCMVSDIHRTIITGGWFYYPANKLRLLYECNPMSFIIENLGGKSVTNENYPVLDLPFTMKDLHAKTSIYSII